MRRDLLALHVALFVSGAAGLVYESSWTRLLHRVFGVSDLAVATVLAVFFLGLGLGNAIAARFVERVKKPARAYAILEVAVGVYALLSLALVPGLGAAWGLVGPGASFAVLTLVRFAFAALVLLPPTILMGATLPVVALAAPRGEWSRSVTAFYASNTLGAVFGAGITGFVLVPQIGTRLTVVSGAVGSFAAAAIVLALLGDVATPSSAAPEPEDKPADEGRSVPLGLAAVLTSVAGLCALGGEVVWTRVLRIVVHATTPAFAAMLVNYLLGIACGAYAARWLTRRWRPATVFAAAQMVVVLLTALSMAIVPFAPRIIPILSRQEDTVPHATWVIGLVSFALLFPLAFTLGTSLPTTWSMIERRSDAGRGAAVLLGANTIGGLVGSVAAGFFLIPAIGTEATLLSIAGLHAAAAAIALRGAGGDTSSDELRGVLARVVRLVSPFAVFVLVLLARPSIELRFLLGAAGNPSHAVFAGPGPEWESNVAFLREGRSTTVTVLQRPGVISIYNDGRPESGFSMGTPGFGPELVLLGGLPGVLAEERRDAMIVGLGAGHTASMALATGFEHVRVVELEEAVVEASRLVYEARERSFPLDDPRAELVVDDARNQLQMMPGDSLDAVISQPSHPWLAGSSALYTVEFFREVDRALRDGGVFGLWVNLFRMDLAHLRSVIRTLLDVFPNVRGFVVESSSLVLMASHTERPLGDDASARIEAADAAGPFFSPHGLGDATRILAYQEMDTAAARALAGDAPRIVDDRPTLELDLARLPNSAGLGLPDLDWALRDVPWTAAPVTTEALMARVEACQTRGRALDRVARLDAADAPVVRGRIAEARGDVRAALAAYDAVEGAGGRKRSAALRYAEGLEGQLAAMGRAWPADLEIDDGVLLSALQHPDALDPAVVAAARRASTPLAAYFVQVADGGCGGDASARERGLAGEHAEVARYEARCAMARGDTEAMLRYEQLAWRARTVRAAAGTRQGEAALAGGNGGLAMMLFTRVLRTYPTTTRAAIGLARLHVRDGRRDDARETLRVALEATTNLEEAQSRIVDAASSLGIELPPPEAGPGESSASTAPAMTETE